MELLHIHYHAKNKAQKYLLLLCLGQYNNRTCGIITEFIQTEEQKLIIENKKRLSQLSLYRKLEWLKTHCPQAYKHGYREIKNSNITIVNKYNL